MSYTITMINKKGGTGKTAVTVNLAVSLAQMGKRVCVGDTDPQGNTTQNFGYMKNHFDPELNEKAPGTLSDVFVNDLDIRQVILPTNFKNISLIPADDQLKDAKKEIQRSKGTEFFLQKALKPIRAEYDYILIDTPPDLDDLTMNAVVASDYLLIVATSNSFSRGGIADVYESFMSIVEDEFLNPNDVKILGLVHNNYDARKSLVNTPANEDLQKAVTMGIIPRVFPKIRTSSDMDNSVETHKTLFEYNPNSEIVSDFDNLAEEIIDECEKQRRK